MLLFYKYRIKDRTARKTLRRHAWAVNQVWNYCAAYQRDIHNRYRAGARKRRWPSNFDLHKLTAGTSKELGLRAGSINEVCRVFTQARDARRRAPRFRASAGRKRSLGWVPFRAIDRRLADNSITYLGKTYRFWLGNRPLPDAVRGGAFVEDSLGRWFVCLLVDVPSDLPCGDGEIGIDLGLISLATLSDGTSIKAPRHAHQYAERLSAAQRARNWRRTKAINQNMLIRFEHAAPKG